MDRDKSNKRISDLVPAVPLRAAVFLLGLDKLIKNVIMILSKQKIKGGAAA